MGSRAKYKILADELRENIHKGLYPDGHTLMTEYELAKEYNMSRQTVRHALGLLEAEGLIYRKKGSGTYVRQKRVVRAKTMTIGVIVTYMSEYIFPAIVRGIESELSHNGYTMKLSATSNNVDNERNLLIEYIKNPVDGLIIEGTKTSLPNPNISLFRRFDEMGIPYVFINGYYPELKEAAYVVTDDREAGEKAVHYLVKKGHKNIAGIFKSDDMQGVRRYQGYLEALLDEGLGICDKCVFWFTTENKDYLFLSEFGSILLKSIEGCTAIVCYNDEVAVKLIELLKQAKISVPKDMAIISFDNSVYSNLNSIKITSLDHPKEDLGKLAAKQLINTINGDQIEHISLSMDIIEKEST